MLNNLTLITGASSGIGAAFAHNLAARGDNLIITGRNKDKLEVLAQELMEKHDVSVEIIVAELSKNDDSEMLVNRIKNLPNLSMLINNAGFGLMANFIDGDIEAYEKISKVHMLAVMKFTYAALQNMKRNNQGAIINVSSIGAYMPMTQSSVYVATKAFVSMLTETIAFELADTNIRIQSLCPGVTDTNFFNQLGVDVAELVASYQELQPIMSAEEVVKISLEYLKENKMVCIPGVNNQQLVKQQYLDRGTML